jgi:hypothetical protein
MHDRPDDLGGKAMREWYGSIGAAEKRCPQTVPTSEFIPNIRAVLLAARRGIISTGR